VDCVVGASASLARNADCVVGASASLARNADCEAPNPGGIREADDDLQPKCESKIKIHVLGHPNEQKKLKQSSAHIKDAQRIG
jgi:hypothetical protein